MNEAGLIFASTPEPLWWHYVIGYAFSLIAGSLLIGIVINRAWDEFPISRPYSWHPAAIGLLERSLFTSAYLLDQGEFIAVWLAIKAAGQWNRWAEDVKDSNGKVLVPGRSIYNVFILGAGLSVIYGVVGALLIEALSQSAWSVAVTVPVAVAVGSLLLPSCAKWVAQQGTRLPPQ